MSIAKLVNYYQYKSLWELLKRFPWLQGEAPALRTGVKDVVTRWGSGANMANTSFTLVGM